MALPRDEQNVPQTSKLEDIFYCAARRRRLPLSKCLDDYMNTNAMTQRPPRVLPLPAGPDQPRDLRGDGLLGALSLGRPLAHRTARPPPSERTRR